MLRKRLVVLVAAAVMMLCMIAASAPVFAQGEGDCDPQPGQVEKSQGPIASPPQGEPGLIIQSGTANEHDQQDPKNGFGERVDECA